MTTFYPLWVMKSQNWSANTIRFYAMTIIFVLRSIKYSGMNSHGANNNPAGLKDLPSQTKQYG